MITYKNIHKEAIERAITLQQLVEITNVYSFRKINMTPQLRLVFKRVCDKRVNSKRNYCIIMDMHAGMGGKKLTIKHQITVPRCGQIFYRSLGHAINPCHWRRP